MLTFLGAVALCVLSLLTPDSALLGGSEKVTVPLAGPVSFVGFMIVGPAVLILLRAYREIFVEYGNRLAQLAALKPEERDPTLLSSRVPIIRIFFDLVLYLALPLTMCMFTWKAAVFPGWGAVLLCTTAAVTLIQLRPSLRRFSWRSKASLAAFAVIGAGRLVGFDVPRRPFNLFRANLSDQWLVDTQLEGANLTLANLKGAFPHERESRRRRSRGRAP